MRSPDQVGYNCAYAFGEIAPILPLPAIHFLRDEVSPRIEDESQVPVGANESADAMDRAKQVADLFKLTDMSKIQVNGSGSQHQDRSGSNAWGPSPILALVQQLYPWYFDAAVQPPPSALRKLSVFLHSFDRPCWPVAAPVRSWLSSPSLFFKTNALVSRAFRDVTSTPTAVSAAVHIDAQARSRG